MEKNKEMLIKSYLSNVQVGLNVAAYTHCPEDWRDINYRPDYSKFYFICSGEGWIKIGDREFYPKPGSLCLMPAGKLQSYSTISKNTFTKYWCHFTAAVGEVSLFDIVQAPCCIDVSDREGMEFLFKRLISAYESQSLEASLLAKSALLELIARYICFGASEGIELPDTVSGKKLLQITKYIDDNLSRNISVEELAEITHFHPNYFIKFFKKHLGTSPAHYINKKRMEKSKSLLRIKDITITQVSEVTGFNDVYHFSKAFKNYTGFSPTEFRKVLDTNPGLE